MVPVGADLLRRSIARALECYTGAIGRDISSWKMAAMERLRPWAEGRGHTTAELAIASLLGHPEVSTVIVGARSTDQVEANIRAAEWWLSPEEMEEARRLATS